MPAGAQTWGLHETLLEPKALPPPPVRHALLAFVVVLAAILHLGTAGWSEISNGIEGELAGGARHMLQAQTSLVPQQHRAAAPTQPPLTQWLVALSYRLIGFTPFAARLPIALATIAAIALTFLLGEQLSGYLRGFAAALIQLCTLGAFLWDRSVTPIALSVLFTEAALFCAIAGYAARRNRRWWFAGAWVCAVLEFFAAGIVALALLAAIFIVLAIMFREARIRFRELLRWPYFVGAAAIAGAWFLWMHLHVPGWPLASTWRNWVAPFASDRSARSAHHPNVVRYAADVLILWWPALFLILPAVLFASRRVLRPREFEFADALPFCWMTAALLPMLLSRREPYDSLGVLPPLALWAACVWERSPRVLRVSGVAVAAAGFVALACITRSGGILSPLGFRGYAPSFHTGLPLLALVTTAIALIGAGCVTWRDRQHLALAILMLGAIPLGLTAAEATARLGPQFSFGSTAHLLDAMLGFAGELLIDASPRDVSSLEFYVDRSAVFITPAKSPPSQQQATRPITPADALERFGAPHPVSIILHKAAVPRWQERLTARYHLYHQVAMCGDYVIVANQP